MTERVKTGRVEAGRVAAKSAPCKGVTTVSSASEPRGADESRVVELDVREDLREGLEPFQKIMQTVQGLGEKDLFVLYATFEPRPLFGVLGAKGYEAQSEQLPTGDWKITFRPVR